MYVAAIPSLPNSIGFIAAILQSLRVIPPDTRPVPVSAECLCIRDGVGPLGAPKVDQNISQFEHRSPKESPLKGSVGESNRNEQALPRFKPWTVAEEQQP